MQQAAAADEVGAPPPEGVCVSGLWLEGAAWDGAARCLAEQAPRQLLVPLPVVAFVPCQEAATQHGAGTGAAAAEGACYACPLYKTSAR